MKKFPLGEQGVIHLTPNGWVRRDRAPFPKDRLESWSFERERPAEDAKEQVCLTRTWICAGSAKDVRAALHNRFGAPFQPNRTRNVLMECDV
jgi:hypothetical protein